jgi:hypothetical protein
VHTIDLAYVGHGYHEELVAYVADQEGYYEDEGVHVAIRDGVGWETERVRRGATIGLGRALRTLAEQPRLAVDYVASFLNRLTREEAQQHYERYIAPCFTPDGQVDLNIVRQAIDAVAAELGVAPVAVEEIFPPAQ